MTISSVINRASFTGDGSTTSFSFPYPVLLAADLKVYQNGTLKTITTHYTLSGSAPYTSGTNIQFLSAPAADDEIVVLRDPAITQTLDLVENDPLPVESLEQSLDRRTMVEQRLSDRIDRSFHLPDSDVSGASTELPTPEADTFVAWDSDGRALVNVDAADLVTIAASQNMIVDLFEDGSDFTAGATTQLTLTSIPGAEENLCITFDGVTQHHDTFSVSGSVVTFSSAIPGGTAQVEVQYLRTLEVNTAASENVTFSQAGASAVTTNVRDKLRETPSVTDYGAVGDGVTADRAAFVAAAAEHDEVFVPAGSYLIGSDVNAETTWIFAAGASTTGAGVLRGRIWKPSEGLMLTKIDGPYGVGVNPGLRTIVSEYEAPTTPAAGDSVGHTVYINNLNGRDHIWGMNVLALQDASGDDGVVRGLEVEVAACLNAQTDPFAVAGNPRKVGIELVHHTESTVLGTAAGWIWSGSSTPGEWWANGIALSRVRQAGIIFGTWDADTATDSFQTAAIYDKSGSASVVKVDGDHTNLLNLAASGTIGSFIRAKNSGAQNLVARNFADYALTWDVDAGSTGAQQAVLSLSDRGTQKWAWIKQADNNLHLYDAALAASAIIVTTNSGIVQFKNKFYPGTDAAAVQTAAGIYGGSGAPNNANGSNGDFYFRSDGTVAGNNVQYHKEGGTWTAFT